MLVAMVVAAAAGFAVPVTCNNQGLEGHGGRYYGTHIQLATRVCDALDPWMPGREQGYALYIAAHEAQHARGVTDEHEASCRALTQVEHLARTVLRSTAAKAKRAVRAARWLHNWQPAPYGGACAKT